MKRALLAAIILVVGGAVTILVGLVRDPLLSPGRDLSAMDEAQRQCIAADSASAITVQWTGASIAGLGIIAFIVVGAVATTVRRKEFS